MARETLRNLEEVQQQAAAGLRERIYTLHSEMPETQNFVSCGEPEDEAMASATGLSRFLYKECTCGGLLNTSCCCFLDEDFQFVFQGGHDFKFVEAWMRTLECIFESACVVKRIRDHAGDAIYQRDRREFLDKIRKTQAYRLVLIVSKPAMKRILKKHYTPTMVYYMKELCADVRAIHLSRRFESFRAQGGYISRCWLEKRPMFVYGQAAAEREVVSAASYVRSICSNFIEKLKGMLMFISHSVWSVIDKAFNRITDLLVEKIYDRLPSVNLKDAAHKGIIFGSAMFVIWNSLRILGIVSDRICDSVLEMVWLKDKNLVEEEISKNDLEAQGAIQPLHMLSAVVIGIFGLKEGNHKKIMDRSKYIMTLLAGGSILACGAQTLFTLLPGALRSALLYKFGSKEQIVKMEVDEWRNVCATLCSVSKIQAVAGSELYFEKVQASLKQASSLIPELHEVKSAVSREFFVHYTKLLNIHTNLLAMKENSGDRDVPFSFHLAGPAGIGKTKTITETLIRACGIVKTDIYAKDPADEFWSGYNNQKVIVMDEFLIGMPEDNYEQATAYLTMNSNGPWRPPMASVDDVSVGIKGSCFQPEIIVTINNTTHDMIDNKINDAFQRRRRFVIEMKRSDRFVEEDSNSHNVDLSKYSDEEFRKKVWAKFDIWPAVHVKKAEPIMKDMTYDQLVDFIKYQYDSHRELQSRLRRASGDTVISTKNPKDIIDDVLRAAHCIPNQPIGVFEAMQTLFTPAVQAQGPIEDSQSEGGEPEVNTQTLADEISQNGEMATKIFVRKAQLESALFVGFTTLVSMGTGIALGILLNYAKRMFLKLEPEKTSFSAQSPKPNKTTGKPKRQYKVTRGAVAQGPSVQTVIMTIGGFQFKTVPLKGRWFLTYAHALQHVDEVAADCDVVINGVIISTKFFKSQVFFVEGEDIAFFELNDNHIPQFRDITKYFISENDVEHLSNGDVHLKSGDREFYANLQLKNNIRYSLSDGSVVELMKALHYKAATTIGDCGVPIKIVSGGLANKIAGIHVAGNGPDSYSPFGIGTIVTQELIKEVLQPVAAQGPSAVYARIARELPFYDPQDECFLRAVDEHLKITPWGPEWPKNRPEGFDQDALERHVIRDVIEASDLDVLEIKEARGLYPNLVALTSVSWNEVVPLPVNSKIKPSLIAEHLDWTPQKQPAILSSIDKRADGIDPVEVSLDELFSAEHPDVDFEKLRRCADEQFDRLDAHLVWPVGKRDLTFEEACAGIPGHLNSLTMNTSPGYPLVYTATKKGKRSFVWFEGQELKYTPVFRDLVMRRIQEMDAYDGTEIQNRVLGYMKDELLKRKKILKCKSRMTFANDLISMVAFRMKFGALLVALMNNFDVTGFAIGLNQYSKDMNGIYTKLSRVGTKFGAGDYESYDKHFLRENRSLCYWIIGRLAMKHLNVSHNACAYMIKHETEAIVQIGRRLFKVLSSNLSGNFWTTIINCLANRNNCMFCFYEEYQALSYFDEMDDSTLGDDLLYSNSDKVDLTPLKMQKHMKKIGQIFTSAFKDEEIKDQFEPFERLTFLGAVPRVGLSGHWTGALRKETLLETPLWTRDNNVSLDETVQQMVDCASQWDRDFFEWYVSELKRAYLAAGRLWTIKDNYTALHHSVSNRTAASGVDFNCYTAQGPVKHHEGLAQIATHEETKGNDERGNLSAKISHLALSTTEAQIESATGAWVKRDDFIWSSTQTAGSVIKTYSIPFDLLNLGTGNVQDIGFFNYLYSQPELEIKVLVNGTPVQQGALIAWFQPYSAVLPTALEDTTTFDHIFFSPNNNSVKSLTIPFRYFKTYLDNKQGFTDTDAACMGVLRFGVFAQLTTLTLPTTCHVIVYSRIRSDFRIPRPRTVTGQGPFFDFVTNTNTITTTSGDVPVQNTARTANDTSLSLPFDDPPISGGSTSVFQQFSSMSKAVGLEPTVSLQMHQQMLHRQPDELRFKEETLVSELTGRRGYLSTFVVSTSDVVDFEYATVELNSVCQIPTLAATNHRPANLAILNQFARWRGDFIFDFYCNKTAFHSLRLTASIAYGYTGSLSALEFEAFPNAVLEFTGDNQWVSIRVPYNAATEFLKTYDGVKPASGRFLGDYSMGTMSITNTMPLKVSSSIVATTVNVFMFVRMANVEVYEPRATPFVSLNDGNDLYQIVGQGPTAVQGSDTSGSNEPTTEARIEIEEHKGEDNNPDEVSLLNPYDKSPLQPCTLRVGEKYEYIVRDVTELGRRYYRVPILAFPGFSYMNAVDYVPAARSYNTGSSVQAYWSFYVHPMHPITKMFGAWSGHLKYRIFVHCNPAATVVSNPGIVTVSYIPSPTANVTTTVPEFAGTNPPALGTSNTTIFDFLNITDEQTNVGLTGSSSTSVWNANSYLWKPNSAITTSPIEVTASLANGAAMIDISVPFSTNYNVLPTIPVDTYASGFSTLDVYNGRLQIKLPEPYNDTNSQMRIYQAFGDDFRLHGYCPRSYHYADGLQKASFGTGTVTLPSSGEQVGANVFYG